MKTTSIKKNTPELRFPGFSGEYTLSILRKFSKIYDGTHQTPTYVNSGIPFYSVEHVTANQFSKTKYISEDVYKNESKRVKIERGDVLMTRIGDIGTARYVDWNVRASFYVSLALIKTTKGLDSKYLNQYIASPFFQRELWKRTIHVAFPRKINLGEIGKCELYIPALEEQQKIALFLSNVNEWIENLRGQKEKLEEYKLGMMQKIFSQEIRFKDDGGKDFPEWQSVQVGEFLKERKSYSTKGNGLPHISLTKEGVVPKSERYHRDFLVGNDKTKKYKITKLNDLCYNPANLKFNVIALNKLGDGIFSPIYITYEIQNQCIDFVGYYLTHSTFINKARRFEEGTIYERMAVHPNDFVTVKVDMPSIPEQQKIAEFLSSIDMIIKSKSEQINKAEVWKKGLLQKMFI